ncbi:MAG: phosphatidylglycerophosphatase A [Nevskia sp.]|nr:phosphatidylglycerophosphatase A [Nevskia sp.]
MKSGQGAAAAPAWRPSARLVLTTPQHLLAFGLGAGLSPKGPGTAGTLVAVPLWLAMQHLPWPAYLAALAALFAFGCWVCGASARLLGVHDYGGIVFDEVVGFLATCVPLLPALGLVQGHPWPWLLAAFALFRLFDIWKPWPIAALDRGVGGGFGIMLDDLLAAFYAAALLGFAAWLAPW